MKKILIALRNGAYFVLSCVLCLAAVWLLGAIAGLFCKIIKAGFEVW